MYLLMVGINFRSAPVGINEKTAEEIIDLPEFLAVQRQNDELTGSVILPTPCGVEIYLSTRNLPEAEKNITEFLSQHYQLYGSRLSEYLYVYTLNDCIRHLFRVIGGLDGLFADAGQALRQARESYRIACENGSANIVLCTLFEKVIESVENIVSEAGADNKSLIAEGIQKETGRFLQWLNSGFVTPTLDALNKKGCEIMKRELEKALNRLERFNDEQKDIVAHLAEAVVTGLLRAPAEKLKDASLTEQGHLYTEILRNLFCLRVDAGHAGKLE